MKYSFMSFSTPELTLAEMLALAKRFGYDGIEPRLQQSHKHGIELDTTPEARAAICETVAGSDVELACLATSLQYANPEEIEESIRMSHACIDLAGDLGVTRLRVFGGGIGGGLTRDEAIDLVASALRDVSAHAGERGVILCMETHDAWCDPMHVAAVMERVAHPNIAVNWDIMHPVREKIATIGESFDVLCPWIQHVHVHDGTGDVGLTLVPIGTGYVDHRAAIELLARLDYRGTISGEWIQWDEPYETYLPRELETMKGYERECEV